MFYENRERYFKSTLCYNNLNNRKQSEILVKVIERLYQRHADIQESINFVIADVCREETASPEKVVFASVFVVKSYLRRTLDKRIDDIVFSVKKTVYENDSGNQGIFNGLTQFCVIFKGSFDLFKIYKDKVRNLKVCLNL